MKKALFTKKEILALKPGTWIFVKWNDSEPTSALLVFKPENEPGEIPLTCFHPKLGHVNSWVVHTQVIGIGETILVPEPVAQVASIGA